MKKVLKIVLGVVAILFAIILILGLIMPKTFEVSRSVTIEAPKEFVFLQMNSLEKMEAWSPWARKDPNIVVESIGTSGTVGSIRKWKGNSDVGEGEQEITKIVPNELMQTELRFKEPMASTNQASLSLKEENGKTVVTWSMNGESPFPWNAMGAFMSMDKMLGPDFEQGLGELKTLVESGLK